MSSPLSDHSPHFDISSFLDPPDITLWWAFHPIDVAREEVCDIIEELLPMMLTWFLEDAWHIFFGLWMAFFVASRTISSMSSSIFCFLPMPAIPQEEYLMESEAHIDAWQIDNGFGCQRTIAKVHQRFV